MGFNTRLYGSVIFRCRFSVLLWVHLIYYIYARNDRFRHADGLSVCQKLKNALNINQNSQL